MEHVGRFTALLSSYPLALELREGQRRLEKVKEA